MRLRANISHGTYVLLQKENEKKGNIKLGSANRNVCGAFCIIFYTYSLSQVGCGSNCNPLGIFQGDPDAHQHF